MVLASQSFLIVIVLLLASMFATATHAQQTDTTSIGKFPPVKSETLERQAVQLPQDLQGERNLLFIAFERNQQKDIDTWLSQMRGYEDLDKGFSDYRSVEPLHALVHQHGYAQRHPRQEGSGSHHHSIH